MKEGYTMTNSAIILNRSFELMKQGILSGSGCYAEIEGENGPETIELPEVIHTFAAWKARGYMVKKGEHAIAAFHIWKYADRRRAETEESETDGEQENGGRCFLKKSFFFKASQVEKITA